VIGDVSVVAVKAGPGGLVAVTLRLDDGTVRRLVVPQRLAGVQSIEWAAAALANLTALQGAIP
jgi:hypothetical protein